MVAMLKNKNKIVDYKTEMTVKFAYEKGMGYGKKRYFYVTL